MKSITIRRLAITGAGIGASLCLAGTALAVAPPVTVTVGGSATGTHSWTAATTGATPQVDFHTDYVNMGCDSGTATGTMTAGTTGSNPAEKVGEITGTTWTNCVGPLGLTMVVHPDHSPAWNIMVTDDTGNLTSGFVSGVDATVVAINPTTGVEDPALCSFHVAGEAAATLDTSAQSMSINQDTGNSAGLANPLVIDSATGCGNQVLPGDPAAIIANYAVTSPDGAIDVS